MDPQIFSSVPHLTTALQGPLERLEVHLLDHQTQIEAWFRQQWRETPAPFYASVDLRNAGFKMAPVDTNLFPAGFNNLNPAFLPLCVQAVQSAIEKYNMTAMRILLVPENHTRNLYYLESVATLRDILQKAGYEVRLGSMIADLTTALPVELPSGRTILLEPIVRKEDCVYVDTFKPCLVLLNNDLSAGSPAILQNIQQLVLPPLHLSWTKRLKSEHFSYYKQIAHSFAEMVGIDSWLIEPLFKNCGEIDFIKKSGEQCLADNVAELLASIEEKYQQYNIQQSPFVVIKADAGTYGMAVMTVHTPEEIFGLNRKQRTKMSALKEGKKVKQVILQEGVYTFEKWGDSDYVAEPVVYMIDHFVVGGFYRVHTRKGINESLNAPGMHFEPLAFADFCNNPDINQEPDASPNRFYAYGVIARLALLAAAKESINN